MNAATKFLHWIATQRPNECVPWFWGRTSDGYGVLEASGARLGIASRLVCELAHGPPPAEFWHAAHTCGRRDCVNPLHLRWATPAENEADKLRHGGRGALQGEAHPHAKLTEYDVRRIRAAKKGTLKTLARELGVSEHAVYEVRRGKNWQWVK